MSLQIFLSLAPTELATLPRRARAIERAGLDGLGFGDSPRYADPYVSATVAAQATERLMLGPFVTNLVTRIPGVTAQALRTLEHLAPDRVFAGLGSGDSALSPTGARPLPATAFVDALGLLRAAWPPPPTGSASGGRPLLLAANGPRMIAAGAAAADVVVTGTGIDPDTLARGNQAVTAAAAAAGRAGSVSHWCMVRMAVHDEVGDATRELRPLLASGANHVFAVVAERRLLAPSVRSAIDTLRAEYDYRQHGVADGNPNAEAVDRLRLRDALADRFALAGPPDLVAAGLARLAAAGVGGIVVPAVGLDVDTLIDRLGREVLPEFRRLTAVPGRR